MLSARETFHAAERTIVAGELVEDDDAVVDGNEHLFSTGVESDADTSAALEALRVEAEAASAANADLQKTTADLQAKVEALTAERDAALAAAAAAAEPAKTTAAKPKG